MAMYSLNLKALSDADGTNLVQLLSALPLLDVIEIKHYVDISESYDEKFRTLRSRLRGSGLFITEHESGKQECIGIVACDAMSPQDWAKLTQIIGEVLWSWQPLSK